MNQTIGIGVSVCIFTYNYEKYLSQAIDSVLAQKANFPVEIIIGDDFSTDKTRSIAMEYANRHPEKIVLSFNETNIGGTLNWLRTINCCKGKYVALLDGDDYFTDPYKLQKQYDALENNPEYVLSFHSVEEKYDDIVGNDKVITYEKSEYTVEDFLRRGWFVRTAATFFKNGIAPAEPPQWVYDYPYRYDTILHVFLCKHGKAICLPDKMSVWRKHSKGMSYVILENAIKNVQKEIGLALQLDAYTGYLYTKAVKKYTSESYTGMVLAILRSPNRLRYVQILMKNLPKIDLKYLTNIFLGKINGSKKIRVGQ